MDLLPKKFSAIVPRDTEDSRTKDFFDCVAPGVIQFLPDKYILGDSYRCVWVIREYPPVTEQQAVLSHLADLPGVTLRIYNRLVDPIEQNRIVSNAQRKNKLMSGDNDITEAIQAENNLMDVAALVNSATREKAHLLHCAVFLELRASTEDALKALQSAVQQQINIAKMEVDRLTLRQKEGFLSVAPFGSNQFGAQYERVLPAASVANLYPFNFSGKTDPQGFYIGRDKFGTNIIVDLDRRSDDKTNGSVLVLGNSGMGKSTLVKLLLTNLRESGKRCICLDVEGEYEELTHALGGTYLDLLSGVYTINVLQPKAWSDTQDSDPDAPEAFRKVTQLSQHIAFLKDFFRAYKGFSDAHIDTIELMLEKLYDDFCISEDEDLSKLEATDFPILSDLYALCEKEYRRYDSSKKNLYTETILQEICLGLHSMCQGSESKYFNGYTNIKDDTFLCFGVKGLMDTNERLRTAMLFNILSYMSNALIGQGNTVAAIDELYMYLSSQITIEYIRNCMKRVRKRDSIMILASQNVEDFLLPGIREFTKPLFSIPTHQFLFYPGHINSRDYMDALQLEEAEYERISAPQQRLCLYRCGSERYLLDVKVPEHKMVLFGKAGGR